MQRTTSKRVDNVAQQIPHYPSVPAPYGLYFDILATVFCSSHLMTWFICATTRHWVICFFKSSAARKEFPFSFCPSWKEERTGSLRNKYSGKQEETGKEHTNFKSSGIWNFREVRTKHQNEKKK